MKSDFGNMTEVSVAQSDSAIYSAISSHISWMSTPYPTIHENDDLIQQSQCSPINPPSGDVTIPHT